MEIFSILPRQLTEGASVITPNQCTAAPTTGTQVVQKSSPKSQNKRRPLCGQRFLVLSLMTTCVLIFHTPQQVYVTWWFITQIDVPSVLAPFNLMLAVPAVMDPILFTVTLSDVQKAVLGFVRMRMR